MNKNANYRKYNDRSHNSSTYHKKDGTPVRAILKREMQWEKRELDTVSEPISKVGKSGIEK